MSVDQGAATAPTRHVEVGGAAIAYRTIGSGRPLLLLNRMRGTLDTWDPLFLDRLAAGGRVVTVDYPGVGHSGGTLPSDMTAAADFVAAFADAVDLAEFVVVGWSWGGLVAQALLLDHPRRVTHAVLIGTNPPGRNEIPIQPVFLERAFKPVNDLADEEVLFFEPNSAASREAARRTHERIHARPGVTERIPADATTIQAYLDAAGTFAADAMGRRDRLATTRTPILVICGDHDISTAGQNWFPLMGRLPTAQLLMYPAAGHGPHHQHPELTAKYVAAFLDHPAG